MRNKIWTRFSNQVKQEIQFNKKYNHSFIYSVYLAKKDGKMADEKINRKQKTQIEVNTWASQEEGGMGEKRESGGGVQAHRQVIFRHRSFS